MTMKVKVSKVFADFINKTAKDLGFKAEAEVVTMSERGYCLNVGSNAMFDAEDNGDYDWRKDEYKAIRVCYPYEYYTMPRYLTTAELVREFRRRSVQTIEELKAMLRDLCEI